MFVIGRGRYARATYPERARSLPPAPSPSFAFDQNTNSYFQISGDPSVQIASATISLSAGSRVKVEALASVIGSVAPGRAYISTPSVDSLLGTQSFDIAVGSNYRTLNLLGLTDAQVAGPLTVVLFLDVDGNAGARVDGFGLTVLTLTEIFAP